MPSVPFFVILNPKSGNPRARRVREDIVARLDRQGKTDHYAWTEGPGHATGLARAAAALGCARVIAVGGDGTVHEVATGLLRSPSALAVIPCGSGNGLARHLEFPLNPGRAWALATDPAAGVRTIDSASVNGTPFFNCMGSGLDARLSERFHKSSQRGLRSYLAEGCKAFAQVKGERVTIASPSSQEEIHALLVTVANGSQYGNNAHIAPHARIDDGLLDLVAIPPVGWIKGLVLMARLFQGTLGPGSGVVHWQGSAFSITRRAPGLVHVDGEPRTEPAPLQVNVIPASLNVVRAAAGL